MDIPSEAAGRCQHTQAIGNWCSRGFLLLWRNTSICGLLLLEMTMNTFKGFKTMMAKTLWVVQLIWGFFCLKFKNFQITCNNKEPECLSLSSSMVSPQVATPWRWVPSAPVPKHSPSGRRTPQKHFCKELMMKRNTDTISSTPNSQPQGTAYPVLSTPLNFSRPLRRYGDK